MTKKTKYRKPQQARKRQSDGPSMVAVLSITSMAIVGYLVGEAVFATRPYSVHWGLVLLGALVGWVVGNAYYRLKGDII